MFDRMASLLPVEQARSVSGFSTAQYLEMAALRINEPAFRGAAFSLPYSLQTS